ncbi:hypothetical protein C8Q74DRAFT_1243421 [Fomes fomentarius]|nr:hypothetical protein C8Q74DRAFT_1243421 [Fomes fomentarius]
MLRGCFGICTGQVLGAVAIAVTLSFSDCCADSVQTPDTWRSVYVTPREDDNPIKQQIPSSLERRVSDSAQIC